MPLVDAKDLLGHAQRHGYAVCAFDLASLDFLAATVAAAEACRAPVILSVAEPHLEYLSAEHFLPAVEAAARRAHVPVALQFSRADSVAAAVRAIGLGCNSVTLNGDGLVPDEQIIQTRAVVEMAHACGVAVEGGLNGIVLRPDQASAEPAALADIRDYVERSGIDFLSVAAIAGPLPPRASLDFTRLAQIRAAVALPLGVDSVKAFTDAEYRKLIENGVAKIHHYAGLSHAAGERLRRNVGSTRRNGYLRLMKGVQQALGAEVERCLRHTGSAGRAPDALAQSRRWNVVEHCILYNVATAEGERQVQDMLADGRKVLGAIPGVREVLSGRALRPDDAKYRYCWLVRFAAPEVIASYRDHSDHTAFADGRFRPLAPDRLSIDFEEVP